MRIAVAVAIVFVTGVVAAAETFPAIDASCSSDADCTSTGQWGDCCGHCEQKYANKSYVARVTAYCAKNPPAQCPPMGCSWGMSAPKCIAGQCQAPKH